MKIARNVAAFGWSDEWYGSFPAPSLRELLGAAKLRECRPMNGKNPNLLSCVGAMKIARNVAVFGWYDEWYGPFPFIGVLAEIRGGRAIFIAPTKLESFDIPPLIGGHSLREGAGKRSHSSGCSLKSGGAGDFHRPYEGRVPFIGGC